MEQVGKLKPQMCVACPVSQAIRGGAWSPEGFWLLLPRRPVRGGLAILPLWELCAPPPPATPIALAWKLAWWKPGWPGSLVLSWLS